MKLTATNEGLQNHTLPGAVHSFYAPFPKVVDLREDPVSLLFFNDTELSHTGWALWPSEEMAKVYLIYTGLVTGKIPHNLDMYCFNVANACRGGGAGAVP